LEDETMKITSKPTRSEVINIGENETTVRFYYGDAYKDKKYKSKNGKLSFLDTLKFIKDSFSRTW
jgi:hypothetical protein